MDKEVRETQYWSEQIVSEPNSIKEQRESINIKINNNKKSEYKSKKFVSEKMEAKKLHKLLMILLLQNQTLDVVREIELMDPKHQYNEVVQSDPNLSKQEAKKQ